MKEDGIFIMSQLIGAQNVMVEHGSPPSFLKVGRGEVNIDYLPWREGSEKLKKRWKYHTWTDLLKRRGLALFPFIFFQSLSFLHLEITLCFAKLCHAFEEKTFSFTIIL